MNKPFEALRNVSYTDLELAKLAVAINDYLVNQCDNKVITDEEWSKKYCYGDFCVKVDDFYFDKDTGEVLLYS